jgi:hypothetical protein
MRFVVAAAALLVSSFAFAYPSIGDTASYDGSLIANGQTSQFAVTNSVIGYDSASAIYTVRTDTVTGGQTQSEEKQVAAADMATPQGIAAMMSACTSNGGQLGNVNTPAGSFRSCVLTQEDSGMTATFAFADVPFGLAAITLKSEGMQITMKLSKWTAGQ